MFFGLRNKKSLEFKPINKLSGFWQTEILKNIVVILEK